MQIDTVIPFHSKDSHIFNWCIQGIKDHLDVARIVVVCNHENRLQVENAGAIFFDEDKVVEGLTARSFPQERWGWYFQQILKLGMADWVETDHYLVVDADTVFLRDVSLFNHDGRPLYATGTEYHKPYFDIFERLLGFSANREYSFTVHHMVYNKHIVRAMRERFPEKPWHLSIVRYIEPQAPWFSESQFNEQDTYGHYVKTLYPDQIYLRPLRWTNINARPTDYLLRRLAKKYDFCSFHEYLRRNENRLVHSIWSRVRLEAKLMIGRSGSE
jgi:Family of unknown function (DUF6492)